MKEQGILSIWSLGGGSGGGGGSVGGSGGDISGGGSGSGGGAGGGGDGGLVGGCRISLDNTLLTDSSIFVFHEKV